MFKRERAASPIIPSGRRDPSLPVDTEIERERVGDALTTEQRRTLLVTGQMLSSYSRWSEKTPSSWVGLTDNL